MAPPDERSGLADGPQLEEEKLRSLATDVCNGMLRTLTGLRTYAPGHTMLLEFQARLLERVTQVVQGNGELRLEVHARSFSIGDKDVFKDSTDPICRRLFTEGVQTVTFREGVTGEELNGFLGIWHRVRRGDLPPDHNFATLVWEAGFKGIQLSFVDSFMEGSDAEEPEAQKEKSEKKKKTREEDIVAVSGELSAKALPGGGLEGGKSVVVAKAALASLLSLDSIAGVTAQDLEQLQSAQRAVPAGLGDADRRNLLFEIEAARRDAPRRALADLWYTAAFAAADERERVLGAARALIGLLIREGEYGPLAGALKEIGAGVRADPRRGEEFKGWIAAFLEPENLKGVGAALDDPARAASALELMRLVPRTELGGLIGMLGELKTHEGRLHLIELLVARQVTGEQLVGRVGRLDPSVVPYLLTLKERLPSDGSNWFVAALLNSEQVVSRRDGIARLKPQDVAGNRDRLLQLVDDADIVVRLGACRLLSQAGEQAAAIKLVHRLQLGGDDGEREQLLRALGRLGGGLAAEALRRQFQECPSDDLKAVCAEMLGNLQDAAALPLLEPVAKKWFGNKHLKDACHLAVLRIRTAAGRGGAS